VDKRYRQLLKGSQGSHLAKSQSPSLPATPSQLSKISNPCPELIRPLHKARTASQLTPTSLRCIDDPSFSVLREHPLKKCNSQTLTTMMSRANVKEENREDSDGGSEAGTARQRKTRMQYLEEEVSYLRGRFLEHYRRTGCALIH
jgi:hypothetical protein